MIDCKRQCSVSKKRRTAARKDAEPSPSNTPTRPAWSGRKRGQNTQIEGRQEERERERARQEEEQREEE